MEPRSNTRLPEDYEPETVLGAIGTAVIVSDARARIRYANRAAGELLGQAPELLVGRDTSDANWVTVDEAGAPVPGDRRPAALTAVTGRAHAQILGLRRDDWLVWLHVSSVPLRPGGDVVTTVHDVTATKAAEVAARQSETRFRALAMNSPVGIFWTDAAGVARFFNPSLERIVGRRSDDAAGVDGWLTVVAQPDERDRVLAAWRAAVDAHGLFEEDFRIERPDGTVRWVHARAAPATVADGFVGSVIDVTDRVEDRLLLQGFLDHSPSAVYVKDLDGRYTLANRRTCELLGVREGELFGRSDREVLPAEAAARREADRQWVLEHDGPAYFEERFEQADGTLVVLSAKFPLRDTHGRLTGVGGISTDITDRVRTEQALADAEARLRGAERLTTLAQLAGGVAHDFNNLLGTIRLQAALAEQALEPAHPARAEVADIIATATRAAELTRRLLDLGRRPEARPEPLALGAVLAEMRRLLERSLGAEVGLRTVIAADTPSFHADRGELEQVLLNVIVNAGEAMTADGEVRLEAGEAVRAADEPDHPELPELPAGRYVRLRVTDDGPGIASDLGERVFEPFVTTKRSGTGLGLAIVRTLMSRARGSVGVAPAPGGGTVVELLWPVAAPTVATEVSTPRPVEPPLVRASARARVLLVEDEPALRRATARLLESAGLEVTTVAHADGALAELRRDPPRVLVCDIVLPGLSGAALARRAREMVPGIVIVLMSGHTADKLTAIGVTEDEVLAKPYPPDALIAAVRRGLDPETP